MVKLSVVRACREDAVLLRRTVKDTREMWYQYVGIGTSTVGTVSRLAVRAAGLFEEGKVEYLPIKEPDRRVFGPSKTPATSSKGNRKSASSLVQQLKRIDVKSSQSATCLLKRSQLRVRLESATYSWWDEGQWAGLACHTKGRNGTAMIIFLQ